MVDSVALAFKLQKQGDSLLDVMGYREAETIFNKAFGIAKRYKEIKLQGKIANNLAECYSMTGRHQKAEDMYHEAFDLFSSIPDTNAMAVMLINLGDEYAKTGRIELAAETELKAIKLKEDNHDYRKLAFYYQKLGELFIDRDNAKWEHYVMKALELSRTEEFTTLRATVAIYNDLGAIWRIKNDFEKASSYYDTMYRISEAAGYKKGIITATSERALLHYDMGKYQEALPLAIKASEMVQGTDDDYHILYGDIIIARIYLKINQPQKAIGYLQQAVARAKKAGLRGEEMESYQYLTIAHRALSNWKDALQAQDRYIGLKDSLDGVEVRRALNDMQTRFETEKKQQLINRLSEKNELHEKRNRMLIMLLIVTAIALVSLVLLLRLRNRTLKQNKVLREKENEIHKLENARLTLDIEYKSRELTAAAVHLINKNEVLNNLKNKLSGEDSINPEFKQVIRQIDQNINLDTDWQDFNRHFEQVHPGFFRKLKDKFPSVTPNEERLCAYLLINLNTKEISQMLNVTSAAVDKSRNRLRKKLEIAPDVNLNEFLSNI
jgi:tetratricopeptide (TPR) repeat protein